MRKTVTLFLVAAALIALSLSIALGGGEALAYPAGWTSDNLLTGATAQSVDIAVKGNYVHVVAKGADGGIWYARSTDRALTWSNWVRLDLNPAYEDFDPQVVVGSGAFVWVEWVSNEIDGTLFRAEIKRSSTNGTTWPEGLYASTGDADCNVIQARLSRSPTYDIQLTYTKDVLFGSTRVWEVFFREVPYDIGLGPELAVSPNDGYGSDFPAVAARSSFDYWIIYRDRGMNIVCRRLISGTWHDWGGTTYYPVAQYTGPMSYHSPDISNVTTSVMRVVYTAHSASPLGWWAYQRDCVNALWEAPAELRGVGARESYPKTSCNASLRICTDVTGNHVDHVAPGSSNTLMQSALPYDYRLATAVDSGDGYEYLAVAAPGAIKVKRTDLLPPSGSAAVNGTATGPASATVYVNSNFELSYSDVVDDWDLTGTDTTGDSFTNGVTSISLKYSYSPSAPNEDWYDLPTRTDSVIANAPWRAEVLASGIPDGTRYIKGTLADTAGNTKVVLTGPIFIDKAAPITTLTTDTTANEQGWRNKDTTVTLTSHDPNLTGTEYMVKPPSGSRGKESWTEYTGPFKLADGRWKVSYRSSDRCGNVEPFRTGEISVDTVPPVCAVTRPARDTIQTGYYDDESYRVTGTGTDENGLERAWIYVDGKKEYETDKDFDMAYVWKLAGAPEKTHRIEVRARDVAGNEGRSSKNVWVGNVAKDWYFPEGNTLPEFDQYICVVNPGDRRALVRYSFMLEDGSVVTAERSMSPRQRDTVKVKDYVDEGHHVSTHVHCSEQAIIAECPMYFMYRNAWKGGHNVMGINALQQEWYFAEGTTRNNPQDGWFEEWICLQNPSGDRAANVVITYMLETGQNVEKAYSVAPHSRVTVEVARDVGIDRDVSAKVTSDVPIAAVRPMYFNYHGYAVDGSAAVGASGPAQVWDFAEGATHPGFQQWLTIQNPNGVEAHCAITYMTGSGRTVTSKQAVGPRARATVDVLGQVGDNEDVSTRVSSDVPVICERPVYFVYGMFDGKGWTGGETALGNPSPSSTYYLAEGTTISNFDTWYTLANMREDRGCKVNIEYVFGDGTTRNEEYWIEPHSRLTISVNDAVQREADVSGSITASFPIVIERPVYFNYDGRITGGHDVTGYGVD